MRNARPYIEEAWASMQRQTWHNWEWLVVDNGSSDGSLDALKTLVNNDSRVRFFVEALPGASRARNRALAEAKGEFLAFLDIDDGLPENALRSRAGLLVSRPELGVTDGGVERRDAHLTNVVGQWTPRFAGDPFPELLRLNPACFFGLTWMVRRSLFQGKRFDTAITHCEDLLFFLSLGPTQYASVDEVVLHYRTGHGSSMADLGGLEQGYRYAVRWARTLPGVSEAQGRYFARAARQVMVRSWVKRGRLIRALTCWARAW